MRSRSALASLLTTLIALTWAFSAMARPEKIRPGQLYYSDEAVADGPIHDIGAEKNYEEVYQLYTYYEVVYDDALRVSTFREYERGDLIRTELYRYDDGVLVERVTQKPGEPDEVRPAQPPSAPPERGH